VNIAAIAAATTLMVAANNQAQDRVTSAYLWEAPAVVEAMKNVWRQARHGALEIEASFRLDGSLSDYTISHAPLTFQFAKQTILIIPGKTFAVFHVHPISRPGTPSRIDRHFADKYKIKMYTLHISGLYEYDPATKRTTSLRQGQDWAKPLSPKQPRPEGVRGFEAVQYPSLEAHTQNGGSQTLAVR
jgi:hypothetical protein